MRVNDYGYTLEYAQQCAAWTINNQGPARKQCGLPVIHSVDDWIYLCPRHFRLIFDAFEVQVDNLNSRRVESMQRRLDAVADYESRMKSDLREASEFSEEDYDARRRAQTVYFMQCEDFIKIGVSYNPTNRLKQIQTGGGSQFPKRMDVSSAALIATEPGGLEREKELHAKFAHLRHTGEWFTKAPDLTGYIEALSERLAA